VKLVCDRAELLDAISLAASIVPPRSPRKVLENVLLRAGTGGVEALATDLEVSVRARVEKADVERPGEALLPAARAVPIIRELEGDRVEISCEDRVSTISGGGSRFKIVGEDPAEFPAIPGMEEAGALRFGKTQLEAMIRKTSFAAAVEATRYALNGVLFDLAPGRLRLVATDGKRLALCERPVEFAGAAPIHVVVPTKGVQLLSRIARPEEETLALKFGEHQLLAASARAVLAAQLVQGHFPPYDGVVPKDLPIKIELETAVFLPALRRAALLSTKDSKAVRLTFGFQKLTLSSRVPDVGESTVELAIPYSGDPIEVAFDPGYLQEAMKAIDGERFTVELKSPTAAGLLREGESFLYVVMPITIG
jgi:DNA polymerase-3 subunit beta